MTKPKSERGKRQEKASSEADEDGQPCAELAAAAPELAKESALESESSILAAIRSMSKTMNDRFNDLEASLASTQATLASLGNRIQEVENASSEYDRRLSLVEQQCTKMQSENEMLRLKVTDLEARSRRQNIKIVGLPEKIENGHPTEFLAKFIPELLGADNFPKPLEVDRAHRLGRRLSENDVHPRVMIARIHHFQLKEKILQLARQQFPLRYNGKAVHFFPDYPAEVMKQRQAFDPVRKRLRDAGVRSGFIYPARLRVSSDTMDRVFSSPQDAETFAETLS